MRKEINKFLETSLEGAEAIADSLIDNEIVKSIPIVGTDLKIISGSLDLRDKIFLSKIQGFIAEVEATSFQERIEFQQAIIADRELMSTVGEASLIILDKLSDIKKAELLGFYFSCLLGGLINQYQYRRIASAIDMAFIDDIEQFLESGTSEQRSQRKYMEALLSSGITILTAGKTWDNSGELFYEASSMGHRMIDLWKEHKQS